MAIGSAPNIRLATLFYEIETKTKGVERDVEGTKASLGRLSEFIKANPHAALLGLGAAAGAAGALLIGASVKMAAEFEGNMAKVNTIARLSKEGLTELGDEVQAAFRELPVENVGELTDALYQVLSSGIDAGRAMDVVRVATKTAIGGFTEAETVVRAVTSIMNAYGAENLEAARVADVLAKAVEAGQIEMDEIAGSIGNVIGVASAMGVSVEEVAAVLTQLSLNGVAAAEGTTALRAAINDIIRPSERFKREYADLAAQFDETRLKQDGFVKFIRDFIVETNGSSAALKELFNSQEGYKLAVQASKDAGQGFVDQLAVMQNALGTVQGQFDEVNGTATAQYQIIKNNLSSALTALGETVLPVVNASLSAFVALLNQLNGVAASERAKKGATEVANITMQAFKDTGAAFRLAKREMLDFVESVKDGDLKVQSLDTQTLAGLQKRLLAVQNSGKVTGKSLADVGDVMAAVVNEMIARSQAAQKAETEARLETERKAKEIEKSKAEAAQKRAKEVSAAAEEQAEKEIKAQEDAVKEMTAKWEAYRKKRQQLTDQLADAVVQATETMVDDMKLQLDRAVRDFEALGATADQVGQFRGLREGAIRAQENIEGVTGLMKELGRTSSDVDRLQEAVLRVNGALSAQIAIRSRPGITDAERVAAERNIEELTRLRTGLESRIADSKKGSAQSAQTQATADGTSADETERALQAMKNKANAIQVAGQGVIRLAASFGLVSENTSRALQDVLAIAAQVPVIVEAASSIIKATASGASSGGAWGALAGGLLGVAGVVGNAIAQAAKERKERERVMNANTRAIEMLTKVNGDLVRLQVSGRDFGDASRGLESFLSRFSNLGDFREFGKKYLEGVDPARELEKLGISFEDIKEIAKTLGITLDGQIGSYRKLLEAMRAADMSGFVNDFAGALEELDAQFEINAEKFPDVKSRLEALFDLLGDPERGAPELFAALKGFDLSTAAGVEAAMKLVQDVFARLSSGKISADDRGELNIGDLKAIISRLNQELRALAEEANDAANDVSGTGTTTGDGTGTATGDGEDRPPPAVPPAPPAGDALVSQMERLVALMTSDNVQSLTAYVDQLARMNELLAGTSAGEAARGALGGALASQRVAPPVLDYRRFLSDLQGVVGDTRIEVHVHVGGGIVVGDMETLAARLAELAITQIDVGLGRQYDRARVSNGDTGVVVS